MVLKYLDKMGKTIKMGARFMFTVHVVFLDFTDSYQCHLIDNGRKVVCFLSIKLGDVLNDIGRDKRTEKFHLIMCVQYLRCYCRKMSFWIEHLSRLEENLSFIHWVLQFIRQGFFNYEDRYALVLHRMGEGGTCNVLYNLPICLWHSGGQRHLWS